jgi:SAM-dependent methyltransferase
MPLWVPVVLLILASIGLAWFFVPILSGIPWVPSDDRRIRKALELAKLQPGEKFYDLGCGDGRVLIVAARQYGADAIGIEVSPLHCLVARLRILKAGVGDRVSVRWENFYNVDLSDADVVYQFGHSRFAGKLRDQLERQLRREARVVSINVDLPGWQPAAFDRKNLVFLYRMPPTPGDMTSFMMQETNT